MSYNYLNDRISRLLIFLRHLHSYYDIVQVYCLNVSFCKIQRTRWKTVNAIVTKNLVWLKTCGMSSMLLTETQTRVAWTHSLEKMPGMSKQPYWQQAFWIHSLIAVLHRCLWWMPSGCVQHITPAVLTFVGFMS